MSFTERNILELGLFVMNIYIKKYMSYLAGLILALNISFLYAEGLEKERAIESNAIAASVNGVPIAMSSLAPQVLEKMRKYKRYGKGDYNTELQKFLRLQALESLITTELLYQEAKSVKVDDLKERVEVALQNMVENKKNGEDYDEQKMREALIKKIKIDEYLMQHKIKGVNVPEEEIVEYYNQNKEAFRQGERVRSRHVLASVAKDATQEEKDAAYKKAEKAFKLLQQGTPFTEVAKKYSDCSSSSSGGELGYHERGYMPKAYDNVAFSLKSGKLSDIVETEYGYHILEVLDHKAAGVQPYKEVKDFIARYLNIENEKKAMQDHISALRSKAKIEIYL